MADISPPQQIRRQHLWIYGCALIIIAVSVLAAVQSSKSLLWPLGFWLLLALGLIIRWLKVTPTDLLFFLLPSVFLLVSGLTNLKPIYITVVWLTGLLAIWFIQGATGGWNAKSLRAPYVYPLFFYALLALLSAFMNQIHPATLTSLAQVIALIALYWILTQTLHGCDLQRLMTAILLGCLFCALAFFIAFTGGNPQMALGGLAYGVMRPVVLNYNANAWALYPMIGLPILAGLLVHGGRSWKQWCWLIPAGLFLLAISILNMSRSALLAILISVAFVMFTDRRSRKLLLFGSAAGLFLLVAIKPEIFTVLRTALRFGAGLSGREEIWPMTLNVIAEHPFFGMGPGWFQQRLFFMVPFMRDGLRMVVDRPSAHNVFLNIGADLGVVAPLVVLFIFGFFAYRSRRLWRRLKGRPDFLVLIIISALVISGFFRALFEVDFIIPHGYLTENLLLITLLATQDLLHAREFDPP